MDHDMALRYGFENSPLALRGGGKLTILDLAGMFFMSDWLGNIVEDVRTAVNEWNSQGFPNIRVSLIFSVYVSPKATSLRFFIHSSRCLFL